MLAEFLRANRADIIARTKSKVVGGGAAPRPTDTELPSGIPLFFDQLTASRGDPLGSVGTSGSMGAMLDRSLKAMHALVDRSFTQVRLEAGSIERERVVLADLIEEVSVPAAIEAKHRDLQFVVEPVDYEAIVKADRPHLASALANLLQNAFKFTRPRSQVEIRTHQTAGRVLIEIEDECGGLPPGRPPNSLIRSRRGPRIEVGQAVEESGGTLHVRDLPGTGCIFTVDLPKPPSPPLIAALLRRTEASQPPGCLARSPTRAIARGYQRASPYLE